MSAAADALNVLEAISAGVVIAAFDERVTYANPAALRMLGRGLADCVGQTVPLVLGMRVRLGEHVFNERELRLRLVHGGQMLGVTIMQVADVGYACMFRHDREGRGDDSRTAKQERDAALRAVIMHLAHELRNPLAAMMATAEAMRTHALAPEVELLLERMERQLGRLHRLVDAPITLAAPTAGTRVACEVAELIAEALQVAELDTQTVNLDILPACPRVWGDEGSLITAIVELVENAVEAAPAQPIRIMAGSRGGPGTPMVRIEIADRGAPWDISLALRPFHTTKPGKLGMGLLRAHTAITENHGAMTIVRSGDAGTSVCVDLPAAP